MTENRQHPRQPLRQPVSFQNAAGETIQATCRDVSLGGMFVETNLALPFGSKMTVVVSLPGLKVPAPIESTVRWSSATGMGLQFGVMGARETHALIALLSSDDPSDR